MTTQCTNTMDIIQSRDKESKKKSFEHETTIKQISFRTDEAVKRELEVIAAKNGTTRQALLIEALNDLFLKYGSNSIA